MRANVKIGKDKKAGTNKSNDTKNSKFLSSGYADYLFIILIAIFLIIIPFFRGLYFRENYIPSIIYISSVFFVYIVYKLVIKQYGLINSYLDIAMLLLPVVYLISFIFSVNTRDAFDAVLKYAGYFMIYKTVSDLCRNTEYKKIFEYIVITAMFVMSAANLLAALGYIKLNGVIIGKTIYGLYQYSNATAAAMGATIFLSLGFSLSRYKMYEKIYCNLVLATAFSVFVLTLSRGAYVIFAVLALLNIILLDSRKRIQYIFSMLTLVASSSMFLLRYYVAENVNSLLIYLLAGIIIFLILQIFYEKVLTRLVEKISTKAVNGVVLSLFIVSGIIVIAAFNIKTPLEYKIEHTSGEEKSWKDIVLTADGINPNQEYTIQFYAKSNVQSNNGSRIIVQSTNNLELINILDMTNSVGSEYEPFSYKFATKSDSNKIILHFYNYEENSYTIYKDIRILDYNGKIVKKFDKIKYLPETLVKRLADINLKTQSVALRTYFFKDGIKILKENLLIGTGGGGWKSLYRKYQSLPYDSTEAHNFYLQYAIESGILGIAVLMAIYYLFIRKAYVSFYKNKEYEGLPIYIALIMMMGHAFMDFDLSLPALAFLFWMMIGIVCATDKDTEEKQFNSVFARVGLSVSAALILFFSSSIYTGMLQGIEAASLIDKDINRSISLYESAMKRDPLNSNYHMDYAQLMYRGFRSNNNPTFLRKMQSSMDKLLEMGLHDTRQSTVIVSLLLSTGKLDKAIEIVNDTVDNNPMIADTYMYKINVNYEIAKQFFSKKEHAKAVPFLNNMIEAKVQFEEARARAAEPMKEPENMGEMINLANNWLEIAEKMNQNK